MMHLAQVIARVIAIGVLTAGLLAGCGVRGNLDAPPSDDTVHADAETGQGKPEGATSKKHKPFILDGLLR